VFFGTTCHEGVSTNDAYVRLHFTPHDSTEPKFFSFLVANLNNQEIERYAFLLK
jgi:hypothetical protein